MQWPSTSQGNSQISWSLHRNLKPLECWFSMFFLLKVAICPYNLKDFQSSLSGSPLIITIVTAFMDSYGDCGDVLPHMGHYNCFPGGENDPNQSLETTSEFLYFYLIIIVSISINIICFLLTAFFLTSHWRSVQMMQTRLYPWLVENYLVCLIHIFIQFWKFIMVSSDALIEAFHHYG